MCFRVPLPARTQIVEFLPGPKWRAASSIRHMSIAYAPYAVRALVNYNIYLYECDQSPKILHTQDGQLSRFYTAAGETEVGELIFKFYPPNARSFKVRQLHAITCRPISRLWPKINHFPRPLVKI